MVVLLRIVSVFFILVGVLPLQAVILNRMSYNNPDALIVLFYIWGAACIVLGILSWTRANCYNSGWVALGMLVPRSLFFICAYVWIHALAVRIDSPAVIFTPAMVLDVGIDYLTYVLIFLSVAICLTLATGKKSSEAQNLPEGGKKVLEQKMSKNWRYLLPIIFLLIFILPVISMTGYPSGRDRWERGAFNSRALYDLRNVWTCLEAYYADNETYGDISEILKGDTCHYQPYEGVVFNLVVTAESHYKMAAYHQNGDLLFEVTDESREIIRYEWKNQTKGARSVVKRSKYRSTAGL